MALIDRLANDFDPARRNRGLNYFERGAVDILRVTHRSITASVQGEKRYVVEIDWDGGLFEWQCNCDDFVDNGAACKHIWATLLEANDIKRLPNERDLDEMAGVATFDIDSRDTEPRGDRNGNGKPLSMTRRPKPAIWKRRLTELKQAMAYRPAAS